MADRAQVTSVEAIEAFRASLIVFLSKARPAAEEVGSEVQRTQNWLDVEQSQYWQNQLRLRRRRLDEAQQQLLGARMSKLQDATSEQEMAVRRARRLVQEAEEKLAMIKSWSRELENRADPLVKQVGQLHSFLTTDIPKAVAYLTQVIKTLEAYAETAAPGSLAQAPGTLGESNPDRAPETPDVEGGENA